MTPTTPMPRLVPAVCTLALAAVLVFGTGVTRAQGDGASAYYSAAIPRVPGVAHALGRPVEATAATPRLIPWARFLPVNPPQAPDHPISFEQAPRYLGQEVTVEGVVVETRAVSRGVHLLYFTDRPDNSFYIAVFEPVFDTFPAPPADYFQGKLVHVTGPVTTYRGRPQVKVEYPGQLVARD